MSGVIKEEHHLHSQHGGVLLLQEVEIMNEGHHKFFEVLGHFGKNCFGAKTEADNQWTFLQDSHSKVSIQIYLNLVQGSVKHECLEPIRYIYYFFYSSTLKFSEITHIY